MEKEEHEREIALRTELARLEKLDQVGRGWRLDAFTTEEEWEEMCLSFQSVHKGALV